MNPVYCNAYCKAMQALAKAPRTEATEGRSCNTFTKGGESQATVGPHPVLWFFGDFAPL